MGGVQPDKVTETVAEFRARADAWLAANAVHAPRDYGAIMPPDLRDAGVAWQKRLDAARLTGIAWPTRYGGLGLTPDHHAAWLEAAAIARVPPYVNMVGYVLAGGSIQRYGTDAQKERFLQRILTAEDVWCQLFSEPGAGSDLASLRTTATRDGDEYVVEGQKVWCSGGRCAEWGILLARTDHEAPKHKGISFFLLDMHLPGIEVRPLRQMTGDAEFDEVFFTGVRVPADCLLGPLHDGWSVAMTTLTNERGSVGAAAVSLGRRLDAMAAALRTTGGADGPTTAVRRDAAATLAARGRAYGAMVRRQGAVASTTASLSKLGIGAMGYAAAALAVDAAGPAGMLADDRSRALLAAPAGEIAGGTTQIQKNIIGERLLGLPKEP